MRGTVLYGPRDVRFGERAAPTIIKPTDAVIRMAATCVCGSDLWPYCGIEASTEPTPMGHEYCGIVEEVGSAVKNIRPGQFVVGSFWTSDFFVTRWSVLTLWRSSSRVRCATSSLIP